MSARSTSRCPKCRTVELQERLLSDGKTKMDVCPDCRGGWFDQSELDDVLSCAVVSLDVPGDAVRSRHICPRCGVPLAQVDYPETTVEVDVCEQCGGLWLDRGEFRAINRERAKFQDRLKFYEKSPQPRSLREAAVRFVDRILVRYVDFP